LAHELFGGSPTILDLTMSWISLTIAVDAEHAEVLSEGLLELGALSVDTHDPAAGTKSEQLLFDEPGEPTDEIWLKAEVTALFTKNSDITAIMQAVTEIVPFPSQPDYQISDVADQDWVRLTQSQFCPIQISSRLWIVPTWHQPPDLSAINLILDPGLAFGTGSHATTHLCLSWLDENLRPGESVLDYGCGSGILAIAALKLGASRVIGIDIDTHAVTASHEDALLNQCDLSKIEFTAAHSATVENLKSATQVDIVVANILANPLVMLAPILASTIRENGHIVLSGILTEQAREVMSTYQKWFNMQIARNKEGWVLLTGAKT
jgi:ribosomal protein L11 methyltransferase